MKSVPKEIRAYAVKEYITGKQNSEVQYRKKVERNEYLKEKYKRKYKNKKIKEPQMKYRKKKDEQSITINKDAVTIEDGKLYCYKKSFTPEPLKLRNVDKTNREKKYKEIIKNGIKHDIKIIKNKINKYYVCITYDVIKSKDKINENRVSACDPGSTSFITTYNGQEIIEIGKDNSKMIGKLRKKIKEFKKERRTKEAKKVQIKLKNKIDDLHYKTITKLVNENDLILFPKLNVKRIISKEGNLHPKAKQYVVDLRHGRFMERLKNKAEIRNKYVVNVNEVYTTQICSRCMKRKKDVGNSKIYECKECGLVTGRDINASKNILVKHIKEIRTEKEEIKRKKMPLKIKLGKEKKSIKVE